MYKLPMPARLRRLAKSRRAKARFSRAVAMAALLVSISSLNAWAQNGAGGIQEATTQVTSYFKPLTDLMYAIGAVLGVIGAVKVYGKWNAGDQDTQKSAVSWFGSMIFLVIVATVIRSFFL